MAKENITKFFDAAMTDKVLAENVSALAAEHGYGFTAEELLEFGVARPLSDEETQMAAGGAGPIQYMPWTGYDLCARSPSCGGVTRGSNGDIRRVIRW